jgi:hypothetical protein
MKRILAALMLIAAAAVAIVGNGQSISIPELRKTVIRTAPSPVRNADRHRGERHEAIALSAILASPTFAGQAAAVDARAVEQAIAEELAEAHERFLGKPAALPTFAGQAAASAIVPDPTLTPGAIRATDVDNICHTSTSELRHWDRARDDRILAEYGLPPGPHPQFEIDHSIPLCLGGADSDSNLWPQVDRARLERRAKGRTRGAVVLAGMHWPARCDRGPAGDRRGLDGRLSKVHPRSRR